MKYLCLSVMIILIASCSKDESSPSCDDGIQNGNEMGVDCGGDCPPCFTCDDGIQNGNETGVDCGGDCPACPSCDDGIQNGNETGVDCGGDCPPCADIGQSLIGLWEVTELTLNGDDAFPIMGFESVYFKFANGTQYESFNHRNNGQNNLSTGTFSVDNQAMTFTTYIRNGSSTFEVTFSNNEEQMDLIQVGEDITIAARKIVDNLCQGVDCNTGTCIYGYCECPDDVDGEHCEVTYGPAGGIVFYDKGSYSNGWRYIEVYPELQGSLPISCTNLNNQFATSGYGAGGINTIKIAGLCQNASGNAAKTALGLVLNGFDDWYVPSQRELEAIYEFQDYLDLYNALNPWRDIHTSYFNEEIFTYLRFTPNGFGVKLSQTNVARDYFVVRYF